MNNYSWIQKKLHKLVLSPQLIRETVFDIENFFSGDLPISDDNVFVSGLARSGTTILLNALFQSDEFASLSYSDMPFVLAPNTWLKFAGKEKTNFFQERAHGDGIKISSNSPEAFEEVFWKTFDANDKEASEKFKKYISLIIKRYEKKRYLSKNNQNIRRIALISKLFPESKILIPFRDPLQHAHSLFKQHHRFIDLNDDDRFVGEYMKLIGHTEFGPHYTPINGTSAFDNPNDLNHWLEQWTLAYSNCLNLAKSNRNIYFVSYKSLCSEQHYWNKLLRILNIEHSYTFPFKESVKELQINFDHSLKTSAFKIYDEMLHASRL